MLLLERTCDVISSMDRKETYQRRLEELGWTEYRLVQEIVRLRQARGEDTKLTSIQSSINKALKEPNGRATYINDDIVEALGGETVIRWKTYSEVTL
jgi:hypothetical protein